MQTKQTILYIILIVIGIKILGFGEVVLVYSGSVIPLGLMFLGVGIVVFGLFRLRSKSIST